jgi:hypothetical protein
MRTLLAAVFVAVAADKAEVTETSIPVGDAKIGVRVTTRPGSPLVYCNMHDDENTAVEAVEKVIAESGGKLVELRHSGRRRVAFTSSGNAFTFDPNRVFTPDGLRKTVDNRAATDETFRQVKVFAKKLAEMYGVPKADVVVAVHNNSEGGLSIKSYQPRGSEEPAAGEVYADPGRDPDDFFLVTHRGLFEALKAKKFNVVLQDNVRAPDDGSLSVYCGKEGIPYANVEAQIGHLDEQVAMLSALVVAIDEVKPKRR